MTQPMNCDEFLRAVPPMINAFMDRIPPDRRDGFAEALEVGELAIAVKELVAVIHKHHPPMYGTEPRQLERMCEYLNIDADLEKR